MKGPQRLPENETTEDARSISNLEGSSSESNEELDFEAILDKMEHSKVKRQQLNVKKTPVDLQRRKFQRDVLNALKQGCSTFFDPWTTNYIYVNFCGPPNLV